MTSVTAPTTPAPLPVVGGRYRPVLAMRRNLVGYVEDVWRRRGDVVRTVLGPPGFDREVWLLGHPDAAARVLSGSSAASFVKRDPVYTETGYWLGHGILTAEGEEWTRQKRFVQPVFTKQAVDGYADLMGEEIAAVVAEQDATGEDVVDLGAWMQRLTLRVVVRALFGAAEEDVVARVRRSFPVVADTVVRRGVGVLRLPPTVPTPRVVRGRRGRSELFGVCEEIIAARRASGATGGTDLLSRLLAARDGDAGLTDAEVRDQVLVFLLAGHETTATALTFALHLLGRHREVQDAVRAEARGALAVERPASAVAADLPMTRAVVEETMRLYPSAPFTSRLVVRDDTVMGHPVRPGVTVVLAPWNIHRHPEFWTDPLVFDPSRFAPGVPRRHRYAWMPFGGGPRACIGQHFALVEAVLALAHVLRERRVTSLLETDHVPVDSLITLFPTVPVRARLQRRP
ncbi:cytochrome P450 [Phycicoccus flavus]|uniref:Cytochrome P450 n=1 Tax=Phycicoccus flavus TaxID=2502783 RepID=A0A8T6R816_9MICO|nr:cytochrome P450 [Phycicoccus flavus]NHA69824.1 cytochrome P450 [Phycicoccus flavus]